MLFIYCWNKELTNIEFCKNELGISKNTVVDWNNYMREDCTADLVANPVLIGGPNIIIIITTIIIINIITTTIIIIIMMHLFDVGKRKYTVYTMKNGFPYKNKMATEL